MTVLTHGPADTAHTPAKTKRLNGCLECGGSKATRGKFCGTSCRQVFNNRRLQRGAELYDLYMAHRFDRETAKQLGVFQVINRLASEFRREDQERRDGRRSWRNPRLVLEERPYLKGISTYDGTGRGVAR